MSIDKHIRELELEVKQHKISSDYWEGKYLEALIKLKQIEKILEGDKDGDRCYLVHQIYERLHVSLYLFYQQVFVVVLYK